MIYDAQFATFMEILTGKDPGEWFPQLEAACKQVDCKPGVVTPERIYDIFTDLRLGNLDERD